MFVVDTNVLLYAADRAAPEHVVCRRRVEAWRSQALPWYVTWGILYEFLRVSTHPRVFRSPWSVEKAWAFVEAVLESPGVGILVEGARHRDIAAQVLKELSSLRGNILHDAHTAILMREHGVRRIYTRDQDFHHFEFVEVLDPLGET